MKWFAFAMALVLRAPIGFGQEVSVDLSYKYIYSKQWDNIIKTYNFSRPDLSDKQNLFIHGYNSSVTCIFPSSNGIRHGINVSYSRIRSRSINSNFENTLNLQFINLGYVINFTNPDRFGRCYSNFTLALVSSLLLRNVNGVPFEYDDGRAHAFGIGVDLSWKLGYEFPVTEKHFLSPFLLAGYSPYLYSPNTEAVINQTKELAAKTWTGLFSAHAGLAMHWK